MKKGALTSIPEAGAAEVTEIVMEAEQGSGDMPSPTAAVGKKYHYSPKERKFLRGMVSDVIPGKKTRQELALEVYDTNDPNTASAIASENLNKPKFKDALAAAFQEADITPQSMAEVLRDAMGATKTASMQGMVFPSDEPDHSVRVSAVKAVASIIQSSEDDDKGAGNTFNFNFNSGTQNFVKRQEPSE